MIDQEHMGAKIGLLVLALESGMVWPQIQEQQPREAEGQGDKCSL